jgi:hypothetical protein
MFGSMETAGMLHNVCAIMTTMLVNPQLVICNATFKHGERNPTLLPLLLPLLLAQQDLLDAVFDIKHIPGWLSAVITVIFVWSNVLTSLVVTDLGEVLHMIGGTAASFMIFFLPGLLLMNAAIIKHTHSCTSLSQLVSRAVGRCCENFVYKFHTSTAASGRYALLLYQAHTQLHLHKLSRLVTCFMGVPQVCCGTRPPLT